MSFAKAGRESLSIPFPYLAYSRQVCDKVRSCSIHHGKVAKLQCLAPRDPGVWTFFHLTPRERWKVVSPKRANLDRSAGAPASGPARFAMASHQGRVGDRRSACRATSFVKVSRCARQEFFAANGIALGEWVLTLPLQSLNQNVQSMCRPYRA